MASLPSLSFLAASLALVPASMAGFNTNSGSNMAVYWGQNSYGQGSGPLVQKRLGEYCQNKDINIIPLAFMNGVSPPITNFANASDNCTSFADNANLLKCPQIEEDIKTCQTQYGKTILLSLGGATYTQGGWPSPEAAETAAQNVWDMFGPEKSAPPSRHRHRRAATVDRPFGSAAVDGFDFDFETTTPNLIAFGNKLRKLMDESSGGKKYYLSAAPQCVFPDAAVGPALNAVPFDLVMIQFYNNWCGVSNFKQGAVAAASSSPNTSSASNSNSTSANAKRQQQNAFNFDVWDRWARTESPNKDVKLLLGVPAAQGAGGGYTRGPQLDGAVSYSQQYPSFGGVMMWDASQLYANSGFLDEVMSSLHNSGGGGSKPPTTPAPPPPGGGSGPSLPPSPPSGTPPAGGGDGLGKWAQCGGDANYHGPTVCKAPFKCVKQSEWWSSCQ